MNVYELYEIFLSCSGICTDTRKIKANQLFFALKGPSFNANLFAEKALEAGASFAVVDDENVAITERYILVEDVLDMLQKLANHHRNQIDATVIAVGGSNGKTTSKELISAVLSSHYKTFATPGNFNNHIGVPLSLLQVSEDDEFAVIEIGANHAEEHSMLMEIVEPNFGIITNNGKDHLEGFGSIEGVIEANAEIYEFLEDNLKPAFVNGNDQVLLELSKDMSRLVYSHGDEQHPESICHIPARGVEIFPLVSANIQFSNGETIKANSQLFGSFQLNNIGLAACIGHYFDVPIEKIRAAIEGYKPANNRTQIVEWKGNQVILDAYNANPSSMGAMIEDFSKFKAEKKGLIVGDMLELGEASFSEHNNMLNRISELGFDWVICVGEEFGQFASDFDFQFFVSRVEAKYWLNAQYIEDYTLLIKGSRGLALEKLLD